MNNGWIKLHRKSLKSLVFQNEKCWKIWCWCLMRAGHKKNTFLLGRQKINLNKGQFIMGGKKTEEELEIARTTIYYWIDFLMKEGMLDIKKTNKYTIITIKNWDKYQDIDTKSTSNDTTDGHQIDTNNNDNNDNKHIVRDFISHTGKEIKMEVASEYAPDHKSPLDTLQNKRRLEKALGLKKANKWASFIFGTGWDFLNAYENTQKVKYSGNVLLDEVVKNMSRYYEDGETRETIQEMLIDFFQSDKAKRLTISPTTAFSTDTYNAWKQGKLSKNKTKKWL